MFTALATLKSQFIEFGLEIEIIIETRLLFEFVVFTDFYDTFTVCSLHCSNCQTVISTFLAYNRLIWEFLVTKL